MLRQPSQSGFVATAPGSQQYRDFFGWWLDESPILFWHKNNLHKPGRFHSLVPPVQAEGEKMVGMISFLNGGNL
jgi:hypothetical protein